jgi:signal transduction histidine kinase
MPIVLTMTTNLGPPALFEDRHADARMRSLITRFAVLACAFTLVALPATVPSGSRQVAVALNVAVALAVTAWMHRAGVVARAGHRSLAALLLVYSAQIAFGTVMSGSPVSVYAMFQILPVLFSALFFQGRDRYGAAVAIWAIDAVVVGVWLDFDLARSAFRLFLFLLVAHLGAEVARILREALRVNQAFNAVLSRASEAAGDTDIAAVGLGSAVAALGWECGAVALVSDAGELDLVSTHGVSPAVLQAYRESPMRVDDASMSAHVVNTGAPQHVEDCVAFLGAEHILVDEGVRCMAGVPISHDGEVIGVLVVSSRTRRTFDQEDSDRLRQIGEQLGLGLGSARMRRREAEVAARLRALNRRKDEFLANVSHELRTPATTIRMATSTLVAAGDRLSAEDRADIYTRIDARATELVSLLESLIEEALSDAGQSRLTLMPLEWSSALPRWVRAAELEADREIDVVMPAVHVTSLADPVKMERVVSNVLSNALKFSPAGSPVQVTLDADPEVVRISVRDEGVGIDPALHREIFERFVQADGGSTREHGGVGIGLTLAQRFVAMHGGLIRVDSVAGGGSTFVIELPRRALAELHLPAPRHQPPAVVSEPCA